MNTPSENIFPVFDKIISKEKKEKLLNQTGSIILVDEATNETVAAGMII